MSRLVMWNLITLDGYFEGERSWDLAFHTRVWGDELERLSIEQLQQADRLLFGRHTYDGMAAYWKVATGEVADLMNAIPKFVFSRTLERADWDNTTLVKGDAVEAVRDLKRQGNGMSFVFGSGDLSGSLAMQDLFDEYRLCLVPMLLGKGKTLFGRAPIRELRLLEARPLSNGGVILRYAPDGRP
jgi:dihydrofolate reductase